MRFLVDSRYCCVEPIGWREACKVGNLMYRGGMIGGERREEEEEEEEEEEVRKRR